MGPRYGGVMPQMSPMASVLLDPHHQPPNTGLNSRSIHTPRQRRGGRQGEGNIIEESLEDGDEASDAGKVEDEEAYGGGDDLDESAWQTSPVRTLSRESSTAEGRRAPDAGVVHMIYQFNQAQLNRRPGGVR